LLSKEGKFTAETGPTPARNYDLLSGSIFHPTLTLPTSHPSPLIKIYIDSQPTPKSLYTSYKTTRRPHYTAARERANIPAFETPMETLLWNEDEEVTECTIRNVAFWRDGGWVTPPLPTGNQIYTSIQANEKY
jgi:4-amino-4-deoxychorismate lyase